MSTQRYGIAVMLIVGFFAVLAYMLYSGAPGTDLMIGALIGAFLSPSKWYFDSSPGSDRKTELLAQSVPVIHQAPPPAAIPQPDSERIQT